MPDKQPKDERAWWRFVRTNTRAARKRRHAADVRARELFSESKPSLLHKMVQTWSYGIRHKLLSPRRYQGKFEELFRIHPDALAIIERYGTDYTGIRWDKRPPMPEPKTGKCFWNAYIWAKSVEGSDRELVYVEGIAISVWTTPTHHAWNAFGTESTAALDWTWYAIAHWTRYRGIPFTMAEYKELAALTSLGENVGSLFRNHIFTPALKRRLIHILESRRKGTRK